MNFELLSTINSPNSELVSRQAHASITQYPSRFSHLSSHLYTMSASPAVPPNILRFLDEQCGDVHASLIPAITAAMNNVPGGPKTQLSFDEVNEICYEMMTRGDHTYRLNPTFSWWFEYGEHVLVSPEDIIKEPRNAPHHVPDEYAPHMDLSNMRPVEEHPEPPEAPYLPFSDIDYESSVACWDESSVRNPDTVNMLPALYPPMPSPSAVLGYPEPPSAPRAMRAHGLTTSTTKSAKGSSILSASASPFIPGASSFSGSQSSPTVSSTSTSSSLRLAAAKAPAASKSKSHTTSTPPSAVSPPTRSSTLRHQASGTQQLKTTSPTRQKQSGKPASNDKKAANPNSNPNPAAGLVAVPDLKVLFRSNSNKNKSKRRSGCGGGGGSSPPVPRTAAHENHMPTTSAPSKNKTVNNTDTYPAAAAGTLTSVEREHRKDRENEIREWVRSLIQKVDTETK
ncbi:hypothetical protein HDK90DRAFT_544571 [Phyllosticta capitalensis]|uniref:Uncharacterized protein n=2 Tax=Phyllosticta capitalensis TaxID=121624 RepID=A0ABR1YAB4_9PEZI